jgi:hypothetical protein
LVAIEIGWWFGPIESFPISIAILHAFSRTVASPPPGVTGKNLKRPPPFFTIRSPFIIISGIDPDNLPAAPPGCDAA